MMDVDGHTNPTHRLSDAIWVDGKIAMIQSRIRMTRMTTAITVIFLFIVGSEAFLSGQHQIPFRRPSAAVLGSGRMRMTLLASSSSSAEKSNKEKERSLLELLSPSETCKVDQMSGTDLGKR